MPSNGVVEFHRVSFSFSPGAAILSQVNLTIREGGYYLIKGPSGAGKSTLLRLMNRLEEPVEGEILFKGRPLSSYAPPELRRSIMYVQQTPTVMDASVRENLLMPFFFASNSGLKRPEDEPLKRLLSEFLLGEVDLSDNAMTLSVGQLQRLCLIRGLLLSPEVLLLDEPTSALDSESRRVVESTVERMNRESGLTVVAVTHSEYVPNVTSPVILRLDHGTIEEVKWNR